MVPAELSADAEMMAQFEVTVEICSIANTAVGAQSNSCRSKAESIAKRR